MYKQIERIDLMVVSSEKVFNGRTLPITQRQVMVSKSRHPNAAWVHGVVMRSKVIIDGVEYVPVSKSNPNAKQIAIALIERYMGKFDESEWESLANELQVCVSEDMNQPTVMETVAEILAATRSA